MKKKYVKPELFFESFEMNTAIANCGLTTGAQHAINDCVYDIGIPAANPFISYQTCEAQAGDDSSDNFCYHVPTDQSRFFSS